MSHPHTESREDTPSVQGVPTPTQERPKTPADPLPTAGKRSVLPALLGVGAVVLAVGGYCVGRGTADIGKSTHSAAGVAPGAAPESEEKQSEEKPHDDHGGHAEEGGPLHLTPEAEKAGGIKVAPVRADAFGETLTVPGVVEVSPTRSARVTPPVAGKVYRLFAAPGDTVRQGQPLVELDSPEIAQGHAAVREAEARVADARARVQTARAGVEQARTHLTGAQAALRQQKDLAASGQISQPTLLAARNELSDAESEQKQAQAALELQQSVVERTERLVNAEIAPRAELDQARTALRQEEARRDRAIQRVATARQALEREQRVYQGGLLNRQAIQTAEAAVRTAEGEVRQAQEQEAAARTGLQGALSSVDAARANLRALEGTGHAEGGVGHIVLFAPLSGVIAERAVTQGQAVERSSELFAIQNLETVTVIANVPEANAAQVRQGATVSVTVSAYPNLTFSGTVQSLGSRVDTKTRALPVRCLVQNRNGALKPEMFARVRLTTGATVPAITLPEDAVGEDGAESFVFVRTGDGTYERRDVTVGPAAGGRVPIRSGLRAGESVVVAGMFVLKSEGKKGELSGHED